MKFKKKSNLIRSTVQKLFNFSVELSRTHFRPISGNLESISFDLGPSTTWDSWQNSTTMFIMKFEPLLVKKLHPSDQYFSCYHYIQVPSYKSRAGPYWVLHEIYGIYLVYDQPGGYEMVKSERKVSYKLFSFVF